MTPPPTTPVLCAGAAVCERPVRQVGPQRAGVNRQCRRDPVGARVCCAGVQGFVCAGATGGEAAGGGGHHHRVRGGGRCWGRWGVGGWWWRRSGCGSSGEGTCVDGCAALPPPAWPHHHAPSPSPPSPEYPPGWCRVLGVVSRATSCASSAASTAALWSCPAPSRHSMTRTSACETLTLCGGSGSELQHSKAVELLCVHGE